jgi:putative DNA primase/helicase
MVEEAENIASKFLADMFGPSTESPVYVASRPNDDAPPKEPRERRVMTRAPTVIDAFVRKWDRRNRALYFCVGTVKPDAVRRAKETIHELNGLHVDIDFKTVGATPEEVGRKLRQTMLLPTTVVASGHGLHAYWLFRESLVATPETIDEVEVLLRLLADHLGSDPSVSEVSRLMRLPGSHNSKNGEWAEVTVVTEGGPRYDLHELEDWLTIVSPILRRRVEPDEEGQVEPENPFLAAARRLGFKPPVDVEQRLAAMRYQGVGESAIHNTQLSVSAALLNRGTPIEEIVTALLDATRAAAGQFGERWNWRREEGAIRKMCETWLAKRPQTIQPDPETHTPPPETEADLPPDPGTEPDPATPQLALIRVVPGQLPRIVSEAEQALLGNGKLPIFVRAGALMYPVTENVPASDGRTTVTAKLREVVPDLLLRWLAEVATFIRYSARSKTWVKIDPPRQLATTMLASADRWPFPRIAGVVTSPLLRPDGSLLLKAGYDAATQLYMVPDRTLQLPPLADKPTRAEAETALKLLAGLLVGFEFKSKVDRAVALSLILTAVARPSMPVAPLHLVRANDPGTGKSFLVDLAAVITTGRICPVIAAGKAPEESEKRLGAMLREGVSMISLDNCGYDLEGDMLCQVSERPLVRIRILGLSEIAEFECKGTVVATGNNVSPKGDMDRRTLICGLTSDVERPELREFAFDPITRAAASRGSYLHAVFTIIRAYQAADSPPVCKPIGSYSRWTAMVRAPLIWLGEADPVQSMETARSEDPELTAIRELFAQWRQHLAGKGSLTAFQIAEVACELDCDKKPVRPEFRDLLLRVAGEHGAMSTRRLGAWLRRVEGKIVGGCRLRKTSGRAGGHAPSFYLDGEEMAEMAEMAELS